MNFEKYPLKAGLLKSITANGYTQATPIQEKVLNLALSGKNIVGQSQTGTGKTAAFLIPLLNSIDTNHKYLQALILAPTRELAVQIAEEIKDLTKYYGVTHACIYGGASPLVQKKALKKKPAIIVATPGRLKDFINQREIDIRRVQYFVLDEVDRMLDMGFVGAIEKIWDQMTELKQTFTFSATMNSNMKKVIQKHLTSYEFIKVGETVTVDKINHSHMPIQHEEKLFNVMQLIQQHPKDKIIIFTHTKRNTQTIQQILSVEGFSTAMLNGDLAQSKRHTTLKEFKSGKTQILVTTDVAARGLNMDNVGLVINFEVPADAKSYIHRIGRTGRAGASGKAITFVSPAEWQLVKDIEREHRTKIPVSKHRAIVDHDGIYKRVRLDKSTDKKGGKKAPPNNSKRPDKATRKKARVQLQAAADELINSTKKPKKHRKNPGKAVAEQKARKTDAYGHKTAKKPQKQNKKKLGFRGAGKARNKK